MAVSWGFTMLLVVTLVAVFTFSQPLFQLALPDLAVEKLMATDSEEILLQAAVAVPRGRSNPLDTFRASDAGSFNVKIMRRGGRGQRSWTRKQLIQQRRPPGVVDPQQRRMLPGVPRRSVLASFQSDRMVPTGPNPLHNSNRSQINFP